MASTCDSVTGVLYIVVPTNQNKSVWNPDESSACCKCQYHAETLPHVLCHCPTNMVQIRERHNNVLNRLTKVVRFGSVRVDQQVPGTSDQSHPDLVIEENNDVTCMFDNGPTALSEAEKSKVEKYQHLIPHYSAIGKKCKVLAFVIGSLGTWHPKNEEVSNTLRMTISYRKLFCKCSENILRTPEGSRRRTMNNFVYIAFC